VAGRVETFRRWQIATQPQQLNAVLQFADNAYRHPLSQQEQDALKETYYKLRKSGLPHDSAIHLTLASVLVAPEFLYRVENTRPGAGSLPISQLELASRLSYFLWSSDRMPS